MSSKSSYSTILRYTGVLAALGSVVAGILHSCWLLLLLRLLVLGFSWGAAGCSAGCLALCWFLGCWLLWWVGCCSCGHTLEYRMTRWISERTRTRRITDYVCTRLVSKSPVQGVTYKQLFKNLAVRFQGPSNS